MKTIALLIAAFAGVAGIAAVAVSPAAAQGRNARCVIASNGSPTYRGPCRFLPEGGNGSFTVTPGRRGPFPSGETGINVSITERGVAEVYGFTPRGPASRWGTAVRSRRDRACWNGPDFLVCVY